MSTGIEWTDKVWNPVHGCDRVSAGCDHCYALTMAKRLKGMGEPGYQSDGDPVTSGPGFAVTLRPERLDQPLRWRKPRRIFVNSMSDLFHDSVPDEYIAHVFAVMALAEQHTFQVLTKRHARMRSLLSSSDFQTETAEHMLAMTDADEMKDAGEPFPLPNAWLGVSAENQQWADVRIPALLDTPAAVRFVSAEPLLGPIDLQRTLGRWVPPADHPGWHDVTRAPSSGNAAKQLDARDVLHWVIVGGESGRNARPMHPDWARGLRDQCQAAGVAFLFKQWGEWVSEDQSPEDILLPGVSRQHWGPDDPYLYKVGKHRAGRELDGRTWDEYPAVES